MGIEEWASKNSNTIMWVIHAGAILYTFGEGKIGSYPVQSWIIAAALGASMYIFNKTYNALIAERTVVKDVPPTPPPNYEKEVDKPFFERYPK